MRKIIHKIMVLMNKNYREKAQQKAARDKLFFYLKNEIQQINE